MLERLRRASPSSVNADAVGDLGTRHAMPRLVALVSLLAVSVAACGEDPDEAVTTTTSALATTTSTITVTSTTMRATTTTTRTAPSTTRPGQENVSVTVDRRAVPLQRVCRGADGAVVAIATTGRRIILVRELGLALRIGTEGGTFSETDQVRTTRVGQATRYEGTIPVEGQPTPVTMDIVTEDGLLPC